MATLFTRILTGEIPSYKIAEDEKHFAFLDIYPLVEGHTLVIPKKEVDYIFDMNEFEMGELFRFAQKIVPAIQKVIPCQRIGIAVIGLEVPHAHIHLVPLQTVDDLNFTRKKLKIGSNRMENIAASIRANL
jgi:histidine triad (HIT) family protein